MNMYVVDPYMARSVCLLGSRLESLITDNLYAIFVLDLMFL